MRLSSGMKHALAELASWLLAAGLGMFAVLYIDEIKAAISADEGAAAVRASAIRYEDPPPRQAEIKAGSHGHFLATATLNGQPIEVLVDTGASFVALSYEDAQRAGVYVRPSDFTQRVATANGIAKIAPVVIDSIGIGDIILRDVHAAVSEPGRLGTTLLGMTFLGRLSRAELRNGVLILQE
jgi:aspartyl protease family protein